MSFEKSAARLDSLISRLENELGEKTVSIDPDDPWALERLSTYKSAASIQIRKCGTCSYKLTIPFEYKCPLCSFKGERVDLFPLLSVEQMLKSLPAPKPAPAPKANQKAKEAPKKAEAAPTGNAPPAGAPPAGGAPPATPPQIPPEKLAASWDACLIQVSKIVSVEKHPSAEKLYVIKIETGGEPRQLCAGLVAFYQPEQLKDRLVCTVMNLKASKLKGVQSAAMILAGSAGDRVRVVEPPAGSAVGDILFLQGGEPTSKAQKTLSSTIWKEVAANFKVVGGNAVVGDKVVTTHKGPCTVPDLPDGSEIH